MADDTSQAAADETVHVTVTSGMDGRNLDPAYEEGPHLSDPEIRAAKRKQLKDAGVRLSDDGLTDDMKAILREKG